MADDYGRVIYSTLVIACLKTVITAADECTHVDGTTFTCTYGCCGGKYDRQCCEKDYTTHTYNQTAVIVGCIFGSIAFAILLICIRLCLRRRRSQGEIVGQPPGAARTFRLPFLIVRQTRVITVRADNNPETGDQTGIVSNEAPPAYEDVVRQQTETSPQATHSSVSGDNS